MKTQMTANRILKYRVARPGCTAWSENRTEPAAHRAAEKAHQVTGLVHDVWAIHADGEVTGPYMPPTTLFGDV